MAPAATSAPGLALALVVTFLLCCLDTRGAKVRVALLTETLSGGVFVFWKKNYHLPSP